MAMKTWSLFFSGWGVMPLLSIFKWAENESCLKREKLENISREVLRSGLNLLFKILQTVLLRDKWAFGKADSDNLPNNFRGVEVTFPNGEVLRKFWTDRFCRPQLTPISSQEPRVFKTKWHDQMKFVQKGHTVTKFMPNHSELVKTKQTQILWQD